MFYVMILPDPIKPYQLMHELHSYSKYQLPSILQVLWTWTFPVKLFLLVKSNLYYTI